MDTACHTHTLLLYCPRLPENSTSMISIGLTLGYLRTKAFGKYVFNT